MGIEQIIGNLNEELRKQVPLVHNITNYVTVNDCANALLAIGGSPIMADDINEVEEITSISSAFIFLPVRCSKPKEPYISGIIPNSSASSFAFSKNACLLPSMLWAI